MIVLPTFDHSIANELQYLKLLNKVRLEGNDREDRTGVGTRSLFGEQMRFDLQKGFPLLTTKKVWFKGIVHELLWFLSGSTDVKDLQKHGVKIWDEWATEEQCAKFGRKEGDLGPVYGHQWRNFGAKRVPDKINSSFAGSYVESWRYDESGVDQIANAIDLIRTNPDSRRIIVSGWNPKEATQVTLPPCHTLFQFYVRKGKQVGPRGDQKAGGYLDCQLYQRSGDIFLGVKMRAPSQ